MMSESEKLYTQLRLMPADEARDVIKKWATEAVHLRQAEGAFLLDNGWQIVDASFDGLTRQIGGRVYGIPQDEFRRRFEMARRGRLAELEAKAKAMASKEHHAGEGLSSVLCPACRSAMAKSPVCPNCSKGKQGYKILCICTECNHEVYL